MASSVKKTGIVHHNNHVALTELEAWLVVIVCPHAVAVWLGGCSSSPSSCWMPSLYLRLESDEFVRLPDGLNSIVRLSLVAIRLPAAHSRKDILMLDIVMISDDNGLRSFIIIEWTRKFCVGWQECRLQFEELQESAHWSFIADVSESQKRLQFISGVTWLRKTKNSSLPMTRYVSKVQNNLQNVLECYVPEFHARCSGNDVELAPPSPKNSLRDNQLDNTRNGVDDNATRIVSECRSLCSFPKHVSVMSLDDYFLTVSIYMTKAVLNFVLSLKSSRGTFDQNKPFANLYLKITKQSFCRIDDLWHRIRFSAPHRICTCTGV